MIEDILYSIDLISLLGLSVLGVVWIIDQINNHRSKKKEVVQNG